MQEFKPFKEGKVREVYDIGENLILVAVVGKATRRTVLFVASAFRKV